MRAVLIHMVATLLLLSASCTTSDSESKVTTTTDEPVTTMVTTEGTQPSKGTETSISQVVSTTEAPKTVLSAPEYKIIDRILGEETGDTVVVLLDASSYDTLTDLDLYDLIAEIVELFPPVAVVHVVDNPQAGAVVVDPDATEADIEAAEMHYLARLEGGFKIIYLGPFASSGTAVLGS